MQTHSRTATQQSQQASQKKSTLRNGKNGKEKRAQKEKARNKKTGAPLQSIRSRKITQSQEDFLANVYKTSVGGLGGVQRLWRYLKKDHGGKIRTLGLSLPLIERWLNQKRGYAIHKPVRKRFQRRRVFVPGVDSQMDFDLGNYKEKYYIFEFQYCRVPVQMKFSCFP